MEDDLNFSGNGRRPQFQDMEDDLNLSGNGRQPQFSENGRRLKFSADTKYFLVISIGLC
jgi:hypothetical protein